MLQVSLLSTRVMRVALLCTVLITLGLAGRAAAVVVASTTGNTTSDGDHNFDDFWDNLTYSGGGVIYLGNGLALQPVHTSGKTVGSTLLGQTVGSVTELYDPIAFADDGSIVSVDIELVQLETEPTGYNALTIYTGTITDDTQIRMIGYGVNRQEGTTYWDASWQTTDESNAVYTGFLNSGTSAGSKRWGTNEVEQINFGGGPDVVHYLSINANTNFIGFVTDFDNPDELNSEATLYEAQAVRFDSGGIAVVFNETSSQWELLGLMHYVDQEPGQSINTAVYGNLTFISLLSYYTDQIPAQSSFIPEPTTAALLLLGGPFILRRRPRKRPAAA